MIEVSDLDVLQADIGQWGRETFGAEKRTALSLKNGVCREAYELDLEMAASNNARSEEVELEAADVAIFLLGLAHELDFSLADAIRRKMQINRMRVWPRDRQIPDIVPARIPGSDPT